MRLAALAATIGGGPAATMPPPSSPAPGPRSITQSLVDHHEALKLSAPPRPEAFRGPPPASG